MRGNETFAVTAAALVLAFGLSVAGATPAAALTLKECSAKYKEAQAAGTATDVTWNAFRKAECGKAPQPADARAQAEPSGAAATSPAESGKPAVFPTAVSPKYAGEKPGIARLKTCGDQFSANKATDGNGGLRWIQKGGGYWSECAKHLKS